MPKLRPARTAEEAAKVPPDKPVTIEVTPDAVVTPPIAFTEDDKALPPPEPAPPPEIEPPEPEIEEPDDDNALAKQLDEMRAAEARAQRELADARAREEAAVRYARERDRELTFERGGREQAEYDAVVNAIGAFQAEADKAQNDLEVALENQDYKGAAEAQRRIAAATTRTIEAENHRSAYEARREATERAARHQNLQPRTPSDPIDGLSHLSSRQRDWLKSHRDAYTDPAKNARLGAAHHDAIEAGHALDTDGYYAVLEERLGYRQPAPAPPAPPTRRSPPVSAPVSRDAPSLSSGASRPSQVTLSPEQREAARIAGVDEATYARNFLRMLELKKQGHYQERG